MNIAIPSRLALKEDATSSTGMLNSFDNEKYPEEAKGTRVSERLERNTLVQYGVTALMSECRGGNQNRACSQCPEACLLLPPRPIQATVIWM